MIEATLSIKVYTVFEVSNVIYIGKFLIHYKRLKHSIDQTLASNFLVDYSYSLYSTMCFKHIKM